MKTQTTREQAIDKLKDLGYNFTELGDNADVYFFRKGRDTIKFYPEKSVIELTLDGFSFYTSHSVDVALILLDKKVNITK